MGVVSVSVEGAVGAPPADVFRYIADMKNHHPHFLPPAFSDFEVVSGGVGAGTVTTFRFTGGGRSRDFRMTAAEPEPGRRLVETDANSSSVTTFIVDPAADGTSTVTIGTEWQGAGGIGGFFERTFAPRVMRSIYADELRRLDAYAREQAAPEAGSD
ncbi:MAG TPA: SRPBCC family protein [Acidimicrobiales bacterium]|nr:SRPBCC family protein [Acidimicrobiales bacterium]